MSEVHQREFFLLTDIPAFVFSCELRFRDCRCLNQLAQIVQLVVLRLHQLVRSLEQCQALLVLNAMEDGLLEIVMHPG